MIELSRLDKLFYRLEAQRICLDWACEQIGAQPGPVFELGLGHGRTYDHLRKLIPDREIFVFDREIDCIPDCVPPDDRLFLGDIGETLAAAVKRFSRRVVLAHADLGSYEEHRDTSMAAMLNERLPAMLAPGAIVLSDLPLTMMRADPLPLPAPAREGRYFLYRMAGG